MKANIQKIYENDYILSANAYKPAGVDDEQNHREPKEILKELEKLDSDLERQKREIRKNLL